MKASELRIGNYYRAGLEIKGSREAKLYPMNSDRIIKLSIEHFQIFANAPMIVEMINPILLTETLLVKLGGNKDNYGLHEFVNKDCELWIKRCKVNNKWVFDICKGEVFKGEHLQYIKYVHQLQNLYFALTGEELQIQK